jgi:hypothetical protein
MTRRTVISGLAVGVAAIAGGLYRFTDLWVRHYPPTPYDDLLAELVDREQAARLGKQFGGAFDARAQAASLRMELSNKSLDQVSASDIAAGRMTEIDGWLVPQTVAQLSALAAKT